MVGSDARPVELVVLVVITQMCCTLNNTCRTLSTIHKQYTKRNNAKGKVVVHSTTRHRLIATI